MYSRLQTPSSAITDTQIPPREGIFEIFSGPHTRQGVSLQYAGEVCFPVTVKDTTHCLNSDGGECAGKADKTGVCASTREHFVLASLGNDPQVELKIEDKRFNRAPHNCHSIQRT